MGAENSILEDCSWQDELVCPNGFLWSVTPIEKQDGTEGVVFQARNNEKKDSELLQKCAKTLLRLRHPNVVRYLGSGKSSKGFWMATEPVKPILSSIHEMTSEELATGVYDILQALNFMHSKLGVCHNNISTSSVYVSKDGGWKLGGMEHACKFQEATPEFLDYRRVFRDEASIAPEEKLGQMKSDLSLGHARDVFAVGALVDALMDMVKEKDGFLREFEQQITICVSADPSQRPTVSSLLNFTVFRSDFNSIISFVRNVTVKTEAEKKEFFGQLLPKLQKLPELVIARRMVIPLLSRFILLDEDAATKVLPHLLMPRRDSTATKGGNGSCNLLSEELYKEYIIPHLCNIFRVHDCHIRMILLEHFPHYVHLFSREQLEEIFLQILLGVRDSDDQLVASSLRALADLVPVLGGDYVIGGSRKTFFFHGLPKQVTVDMMEPKKNGSLNVSSVLSNTGPTLLKDLAAGAKSSSIDIAVTAEEREKKMKERQQRKEEARLKREERRRKLKESQLYDGEDLQGSSQVKFDDKEPISTPTIEEVAEMDDSSRKTDSVATDDEFHKEDKDDLEEDKYAEEKEASDWSDWEDAGGIIGDEIEEELKNMPSQGNAAGENKVPTSPSPYRGSAVVTSSSAVILDWSDMPEADRTTMPYSTAGSHSQVIGESSGSKPSKDGSLTEGRKKASQQSSDHGHNINGEVASLSSPPRSGRTLKLTSYSLSAGNAKSTATKKSPKSVDDLGFGYDIKSIEIKASSQADSDFFADMAPQISVQKSADMLNLASSSSVLSESHGKWKDENNSSGVRKSLQQSAMFDFDASATGEDASGWEADDNDLDWGQDNF